MSQVMVLSLLFFLTISYAIPITIAWLSSSVNSSIIFREKKKLLGKYKTNYRMARIDLMDLKANREEVTKRGKQLYDKEIYIIVLLKRVEDQKEKIKKNGEKFTEINNIDMKLIETLNRDVLSKSKLLIEECAVTSELQVKIKELEKEKEDIIERNSIQEKMFDGLFEDLTKIYESHKDSYRRC